MMLLLPFCQRLAGFAVLLTLLAPTAPAQVLDPTFQELKPTVSFTAFNYITRTMAVQPDGKVMVSGNYDYLDGVITNTVRRLNADGSADPSFRMEPGTGMINHCATALAVQPDGKTVAVYSGMLYDGMVKGGVLRLNTDGTLDPTFNATREGFFTGVGGSMPRCVAVQPDGKILVGGELNRYDGVSVGHLVRLNPDGSLDTSFRLAPGDFTAATNVVRVETVLVQPDGKLLVGGLFDQLRGATSRGLVRLQADGSPDASFSVGSGSSSTVRALALQPDGRVLVGGSFVGFGSSSTGSVVRLLPTGALDTSFQPGVLSAGGFVVSLRLQADGSVLATGRFARYGGVARGSFARLSSAGVPDATFGVGAGSAETVYGLLEQPGGTFLLGGAFTSVHGTARTGLARLSASGALDASYNPVYAKRGGFGDVLPLANGQVLAIADCEQLNGAPVPLGGVLRLNADGTLHSAVALPVRGTVYLQPDGGAYALDESNFPQNALRKLLPTGQPDPAFTDLPLTAATSISFVNSTLLPAPNGRWIIGGYFSEAGGQARPGLARVLPSGALDPSFVPVNLWAVTTGLNATVVGVQPDGKVLLTWGDNNNGLLARLNADGSLDTTFGTNGIITQPGYFDAALLPTGQLLVWGNFTSFLGQAAPTGLLRLQANGTPDPGFTAAVGGRVIPQPDGRLLMISQPPARRIYEVRRLEADGRLDASFSPLTTQAGFFSGEGGLAITFQPTDGKLLISGGFVTINGEQRVGLARLTNTLLAAQPALPAAPALEVYPNPARHTATLRLPATPAPRPARLLDALGRPVRTLTVPAHAAETPVDIVGLPAGVYVLRCGTASRRLVVE